MLYSQESRDFSHERFKGDDVTDVYFINQVEAQAGKHIDKGIARVLVKEAKRVDKTLEEEQ